MDVAYSEVVINITTQYIIQLRWDISVTATLLGYLILNIPLQSKEQQSLNEVHNNICTTSQLSEIKLDKCYSFSKKHILRQLSKHCNRSCSCYLFFVFVTHHINQIWGAQSQINQSNMHEAQQSTRQSLMGHLAHQDPGPSQHPTLTDQPPALHLH